MVVLVYDDREGQVYKTIVTLPQETASDPRQVQRLIAQRLVIKQLRDQGYVLARPLRSAASRLRDLTYEVYVRVERAPDSNGAP